MTLPVGKLLGLTSCSGTSRPGGIARVQTFQSRAWVFDMMNHENRNHSHDGEAAPGAQHDQHAGQP